MYGKLENGILTYAPKDVILGDRRFINPTGEILSELGFMEVIFTEKPEPEEGYHAEASWAIHENKLERVWTVVENEPIPPTNEERISALEEALLEIIISGSESI